jgi:hypothetical protein
MQKYIEITPTITPKIRMQKKLPTWPESEDDDEEDPSEEEEEDPAEDEEEDPADDEEEDRDDGRPGGAPR